MDTCRLKAHLSAINEILLRQNFKVYDLVFEPAASEDEIVAVEQELGFRLPESLRLVLSKISKQVDFCWFAPEETEFPDPFHDCFTGTLSWSLNGLVGEEKSRQGWIDSCFPNPEDPYDRIWHNKLAFCDVGNGDIIAIDRNPLHEGEEVYLSHEDGAGHGLVLAPSFAEFVERVAGLAGCGEDWYWLPFFQPGYGLDATGGNANAWRDQLQIAHLTFQGLLE